MKIYISGPISGVEDKNRKAFRDASNFLLSEGHIPINPIDLDDVDPCTDDWCAYMRRDIKYLVDCDAILLLPRWEESRGAKLEVIVAQTLDMKMYRLLNKKLVREHVAVDTELTPLIPSYCWQGNEETNFIGAGE